MVQILESIIETRTEIYPIPFQFQIFQDSDNTCCDSIARIDGVYLHSVQHEATERLFAPNGEILQSEHEEEGVADGGRQP